MRAGQPQGELGALRRDVEQALAAVELALLLLDVAHVDELLEHAPQRLLGDLQNVQQLRNLHARVAIDEMQDPVMCAAEPESHEDVVRIADEVAIGEKQKLDQVPDRFWLAGGRGPAGGGYIYVSHVDIFWFVCYPLPRFREMIVPRERPAAAKCPVNGHGPWTGAT